MKNVSHLAYKLRAQIELFLGNVPLSKTAKRFCLEAVYGIQARQSVHLTEIARALNESIPLKKTVNRLSLQVDRSGLAETLNRFVAEKSASRIRDDGLIILDTSDISKKYARSMEHMAHVHDGSTGGIGNGYILGTVVGLNEGSGSVIPLHQSLWSQKCPGFKSENDEFLKIIDAVSSPLNGRGTWVIDRGGDRLRFYEKFFKEELKFLVRLVGTRHVEYRGKNVVSLELAESCPTPHRQNVTKHYRDGSRTEYSLSYGVREVRLPNHSSQQLSMVVVKGFGRKPMMLLTNRKVKNNWKEIWKIVRAYLSRWKIEETLRYMKQSYNLEDIRLLRYRRLQNMAALLITVISFAMNHIGKSTKLKILCQHAQTAAKRLFGVKGFKYYAVADGVQEIFKGCRQKPFKRQNKPPDYQLNLPNLGFV